jgi:hypothetical protein
MSRNGKRFISVVTTVIAIGLANIAISYADSGNQTGSLKSGVIVRPDCPKPKSGVIVRPDCPKPKSGVIVRPDCPKP